MSKCFRFIKYCKTATEFFSQKASRLLAQAPCSAANVRLYFLGGDTLSLLFGYSGKHDIAWNCERCLIYRPTNTFELIIFVRISCR